MKQTQEELHSGCSQFFHSGSWHNEVHLILQHLLIQGSYASLEESLAVKRSRIAHTQKSVNRVLKKSVNRFLNEKKRPGEL